MVLSLKVCVVDRFRKERKRHVYHVTYSDGDEEELSQIELRDAYLLASSPKIEVQWKIISEKKNQTDIEDKLDTSLGEASDGWGRECV
jgi:hypothetical protein